MMNADSSHAVPDADKALDLPAYFPSQTAADWRAEAEAFLQGAPFDRKLKTRTPEGVDLEPIYFAAEGGVNGAAAHYPGSPPFVRGTTAAGVRGQPREVGAESHEGLPAAANAFFRGSIPRGQSALRIPLDLPSAAGLDPDQADAHAVGAGGVSIATVDDMRSLLGGLPLADVHVHFHPGAAALPMAALLCASLRADGIQTETLRGGIHNDPLAEAALHGTLPGGKDHAFDSMHELMVACMTRFPGFYTIGVSGCPYANAGAGADRELGAALATAVVYIRNMLTRGLGIDEVAPRMAFELAMGPHFFTEIAKLRAARMLWDRVVDAFGGGMDARRLRVRTLTAAWNKSVLDIHTNLLRTTTEALSSAVGGVDGMCVHPFSMVAGKPDSRARRMARNMQIILAEECNLDEVIDPAGGSYYIESLTGELGRKAWAYFQQIEQAGGMDSALESGWVARDLGELARARLADVARGKSVLVGVNLHPYMQEKPVALAARTDAAELDAHIRRVRQCRDSAAADLASAPGTGQPEDCFDRRVAAAAAGATLYTLSLALRGDAADWHVAAVDATRAAAAFEGLRTAADAYAQSHGERPTVYLANIGPLRNHKMRMDFTRGLFEVGGFSLLAGEGETDPGKMVAAAVRSAASIVVICGTDADYPDFVDPFVRALKQEKPATRILLAGHPGDHEARFKEAGLDDYIFIKSSVYEVNQSCLRHCGAIE